MRLFRQFGFLTIFSTLFLSLGCAQFHTVSIDPALPVSRSDFGQNQALGFKVIDSRPTNVISKWKGEYYFRSFRINPNEDVGEVLQKKISNGLQTIGFVPKRYTPSQSRTLTVSILQLQSVYHEKNPHQGVKVSAVLRGQCNNKDRVFKMNYGERLTRTTVTPTSFPNENLVNAALSGALKKMFTDDRLLSCLVE